MGPEIFIAIAALVIVVLIFIISNVHVVQQSRAYVIERLGAFHAIWQVGLHIKVPFLDRVAKKVTLKEQVLDYPPQPVITKDNVTMQIDTVVYFQITDPKLYAYGVERPMMAMETLTATTLRNIIGDLELDQTLTSRDVINTRMRAILDEATDPWGIKVNRVELKNILPPQDIQSSTIGKKCAEAGIKYGYHNHAHEFKKVEDQVMLAYMIENTDPQYVFFELDVYWTVMGQASPVEYFKKYPGRFKLLHIKDHKEIGQSGMVGFDAIFKNAEVAGVEHIIVEAEAYECEDMMDGVKLCADYLLGADFVKANYSK